MNSYETLLQHVLEHGHRKADRTGTGTRSIFGATLRFDLSAGFPLITTKRVHFKSVVHELIWMLSGNTNIRYLQENGVTIWDEWADDFGNLGPVYGRQWRRWADGGAGRGIDQIAQVVEQIKTNPDSRRHLVSAWNPADIPEMALPPCHYSFQFYVQGGRLSCLFNMRSSDVFLGLPFNIAFYALLTHMIAQVCGLKVGELVYMGGDVHLYENHIEQAKRQLSRDVRPFPTLRLNPEVDDLFEFEFEDVELTGYDPHPGIKAPVAV